MNESRNKSEQMEITRDTSSASECLGSNAKDLTGLIDLIADLLAEEKLEEIENNIEFNKEEFKHEEIGIIEPQPIRY